MNLPFEITKQEVLEMAAQKLVDAYSGDPDLSETAEQMIRQKIETAFADKLSRRIEDFLSAEMEKLIGQEIRPVNIWGDPEGKPTTIRAELAKRAREFWNVKVDKDGRESSYGGEERSTRLMKQLLKDEFEKAIKSNAEIIVAEFKKALLADATKLVTDNINRLIK